MPRVTICIPAYKQVEYLHKTLDSILIQDYDDYEIVVTDDSPDDSVKELVSSFDFKGRLKYFKNEIRQGSPENWNEAVRKSTGDYIKIMHHDDFFTYPYSLRSYVQLLDEHPDRDFAFSAAVAVNIEENKEWIHSATPDQLAKLNEDPRILFFGNFVGPPSSAIYRNKKETVYDNKLKWVVDTDFYVRCLLKNKSFGFSEQPLITSISGALHNVTNECIDNKEVEIFEYLYFFNKIAGKDLLTQKPYINFFSKLFSKYNINSIKDIREAGFKDSIPLIISLLIYNRRIRYVFKAKI